MRHHAFGRSLSSSITTALVLALLAPSRAALQDCSFPTYPLPRTHHQPDGTAVELTFRGSARNHWYEDARGFPVVQTEDGFFYARRTASGHLEASDGRVGTSDPVELGIEARVVPAPARDRELGTGTSKGVKGVKGAGVREERVHGPRGAFLTGGGTVKNLVLLLRFSDHGPAGQNRTLPSSANVTTIMNAVGGHPSLAPTGSVRDHYLETSYDLFTINSTVVGWLDMPNSEIYYANGNAGLTTLTWDLITDGLNAADPLVDFSDYDEDGDGRVDAITFLHSGYGAEWGGTDQYGRDYWDRMWSHKWTIPTWTSAEGVEVDDYNISPGLWDIVGSDPGRIGVVCHELGHFFGLPDLYDTDGGGEGAGNWCLMGAGSWGFDGSQQYPSHLSAWSKLRLGWIEPKRLLPGAHTALEIENNADLYMLDTGYPQGEYLLIENRQPVGFDAMLPQGGLAIWHIDEGKGAFSVNDPNTDEGYPGQGGWPGNNNHYRVALLQADTFYDLEQGFGRGDDGDVYHSGGASVIDSFTTPNTRIYQGGAFAPSFNRLESIAAPGASMAFTHVNPGLPTITTTSLPPARVGRPYSFPLSATGGAPPYAWSEFRDAPSYTTTDLGPQPFAAGGVAQVFKADEGTWAVNLPFQFPYYETSYSRVYVTPNGCVDLAPLENEFYNTTQFLRCTPRIACLWDDLITNLLPGDDIYVDNSVANQTRIRWEGATWATNDPVNFAITLHSDGRIRFDYGSGNTNLTPTVGISRSHSGDVLLVDTHDDEDTLTFANSIQFDLQGSQLPPGLSLSSAGVLSGTPTVPGMYSFRVRAMGGGFRYDQRLVTLLVSSRPAVMKKP